MEGKLIVVAFAIFATLFCSVNAERYADAAEGPDYYKWKESTSPTGFINGVYGGCRKYWLWHAQERQQVVQNTPCPVGPYAANIINHNIQDPSNVHIDGFDCGAFIEGNSGERGAYKNPIVHAEVEAIYRLMDCDRHPENCVMQGGELTQTQAMNRTFWGRLSMYTTGESCAMDAAAEVIAGIGEIIYGYPSDDHMRKDAWPGIDVDSKDIFKKSYYKTMPTVVIADVEIERYRPLYAWQNNPAANCPNGCSRTTNLDGTSTCKKIWP